MTEQRIFSHQLAWACRILAMAGHDDLTLGHVSARDPGSDAIYMKRNGLGLDEVTPDDILVVNLDGKKLSGKGDVHLEVVLHTEVYKVRPDAGAVIHTHPPYSIALGATTAQLEFVSHDAVLFPNGVPIFDNTPELITTEQQGRAVARALGEHRAVLLRNHGVLVVGNNVPWAVFTALTLERAVRIQATAAALGPLCTISPDLAKQLYESKYRDEFVENYWPYLVRRTRRAGYDIGMPSDA